MGTTLENKPTFLSSMKLLQRDRCFLTC